MGLKQFTSRCVTAGGSRLVRLVAGAVTWFALTAPLLAQTMHIGGPLGRVHDYGDGARTLCCPSYLIWGFDPYAIGPCEEECENGCRDWFVAHRPERWYGLVDFVGLMRDPNSDVALARIGPTGPDALTSGELEGEFDSGARFTIGRTFGGCYQIEFSYLGDFSWQDNRTVSNSETNDLGGTGNLSSALSNFSDPAVVGLDYNQTVSAWMSSRMVTGEINLRSWVAMPPGPVDIQFLVGARYFKATDTLRLRTVSGQPLPGGTVNDVQVDTNNDLYGVQLGFNSKVKLTHTFFVDFDCKGAICTNFASQSTSYTQVDENGVDTTYPTDASSHRTAFLGDLTLTGNLQLRPNLTLRAGYQAIFVTGTALAPQNLQTNNLLLTGGPGQLVDNGNVAYHGPLIGLVGSW